MHRLLVVEDHQETFEVIRLTINQFFDDLEVLNARTGAEAIRKTREENPPVILLDIALADQIDGIQVIREIAKSDKRPKIIIVTALGNKAFRGPKPGRPWVDQLAEHERKLVVNFFEKPFRWKAMLQALGAALEIPPSEELAEADDDF